MAISQGNQHLTVFVADAGTAVAAGDDLGSTKLPKGTVTFIDPAGVGTATPPAGVDFNVVYRYPSGIVLRSQTIPAGTPINLVAAQADVSKKQTLAVPAAAEGKQDFVVRVALPAYGGSVSQNDTFYVYGSYKAKKNDTATIIATALVKSLNDSIKALAEDIFKPATAASGVITLEGVLPAAEMGKFEGDPFDFYMELTGSFDVDGVTTREMKIGRGQGRQVVEQEEFFAGYNSDYVNRQRNWPAAGSPSLNAKANAAYSSYNFVVENAQGGAHPVSQRQTIIVYIKE